MTQLKKVLQVTLPLALGVAILYFLYRGQDLGALWAEIKDANWAILLCSLPFGVTANALRGLRWQLMIQPLGYHPKRTNLIYAVWGNYAVNMALPRAGEIWRCGVISNKEKIPFKKLFGTLIIDRVFDAVIVVLFILLAFVSNVPVFLKNMDRFEMPAFLSSPLFYLGIAVVMALTVFLLWLFRTNKTVRKLIDLFMGLWNDFKVVGHMKEKNRFWLYSVGIWVGYFLYFYITFFAFAFMAHLSIATALFVFVMGSVSMIIPSNGGLGPWQAATVFGLTAYGVSPVLATAYATAAFALHTLWDGLCGVYGIFMLGVKKEITNQKSEDYV